MFNVCTLKNGLQGHGTIKSMVKQNSFILILNISPNSLSPNAQRKKFKFVLRAQALLERLQRWKKNKKSLWLVVVCLHKKYLSSVFYYFPSS